MDGKEFKQLLQEQNKEISETFEKKLKLGFEIQNQKIDEKIDKKMAEQRQVLNEDYLRQGKFLLEQFQKQIQVIFSEKN